MEQQSQPISISIIYEDAKSRHEAEKLCRRLARNLKEEFDFILHCWHFDALHDSQASKAARLATAEADLVIVSTQAGRDLPRKVKTWIGGCLRKRKTQDAALVGLVRMARDLKKGALPVLGFLSSLAHAVKMDYLPEIVWSF